MMNRYLSILFLAAVFVSACGQDTSFHNLSSTEFNSLINNASGTLLDVRTPSEFANGHITGAGQLNYYNSDFRQNLLLLSKDQPVYLYCNTGYRSKRAAEILSENGYKKVYNLENGIMQWNLENLPVVEEPGARPDTENKMEPDEYYALIRSVKPVFIDFYAPWCGPCRSMMPMIDSLKAEYNDHIIIVKINADASKKLVKELQIGSVPYLTLFAEGKQVFEHYGIMGRPELFAHFEKWQNPK
jgi:thioredoxin